MAKLYYESDADASLIQGRKVAVIGYGSQGHAHALNLAESGVDVRVGLRAGSSSTQKATEAGLRVLSVADAAAEADLIMILLPDTEQKSVYDAEIAPHLPRATPSSSPTASTSASARSSPRPASTWPWSPPRAPATSSAGPTPRAAGSPRSWPWPRTPRARPTTWPSPTPTPSGPPGPASSTPPSTRRPRPTSSASRSSSAAASPPWSRPASRPWWTAGYQPESAYFECLHELKLIVDLMYEQGIAGMRFSISDTAEYGDLTRGPKVIDAHVRAEMQPDPRRHPLGQVRRGVDRREPVRSQELRGPPGRRGRPPHREGRGRAPGHDALHLGRQAAHPGHLRGLTPGDGPAWSGLISSYLSMPTHRPSPYAFCGWEDARRVLFLTTGGDRGVERLDTAVSGSDGTLCDGAPSLRPPTAGLPTAGLPGSPPAAPGHPGHGARGRLFGRPPGPGGRCRHPGRHQLQRLRDPAPCARRCPTPPPVTPSPSPSPVRPVRPSSSPAARSPSPRTSPSPGPGPASWP